MRKYPYLKYIGLYWLAIFVFAPLTSRTEGTKELLNNDCNNFGFLQIWDNGDPNRPFASYNAPDEYRLYIRADSGEIIHFGYNQREDDVWYRLKDPNGQVVSGPALITSGAGYIGSCAKALKGPKSLIPSGYDDLTFTALISGDYYIEFAQDNDPNKQNKRIFDYFDATVSNNGTAQTGRLWSKSWDMTTDGGNNAFNASMFAYSKDSVVTEFNFNGIRPWGFVISCNSFGASDQGTFYQRRRSDYRANIINDGGTPGVPEFPLFLNDPDVSHFPTGFVGSIDSFHTHFSSLDSNWIDVFVNKAGQVEIILGFANGSERYIIDTVEKGENNIFWDGQDGLGQSPNYGDTIDVKIRYATGMTHMPLTDVEHHNNGYSVGLSRPTQKPDGSPLPTPKIFWNDSLLLDPNNSLDGIANMDGCTGGGCHQWENRGTSNTNPEVINTWWFVNLEEESFSVFFNYTGIVLGADIESFDVRPVSDNTVGIFWESAIEENLDRYLIERSTDGDHFGPVSEKAAKNAPSEYAARDQDPVFNRPLYYRLKILDNDGSFEYSHVRMVELHQNPAPEIKWDPSLNEIKFTTAEKGEIHFQVISLNGQTIVEHSVPSNSTSSLPDFPPGMYVLYYSVAGDSNYYTKKLILQ